jgi:hypothetical protein
LIEPRLFNRRRYNGLLVAVVVLAMAEQFGLAGLLLGPPLAGAIQILLGQLTYRSYPVSAGVEEQKVTVRNRLEALRAALAAVDAPPPELANLFSRLENLAHESESLLPDVDLPPSKVVARRPADEVNAESKEGLKKTPGNGPA